MISLLLKMYSLLSLSLFPVEFIFVFHTWFSKSNRQKNEEKMKRRNNWNENCEAIMSLRELGETRTR